MIHRKRAKAMRAVLCALHPTVPSRIATAVWHPLYRIDTADHYDNRGIREITNVIHVICPFEAALRALILLQKNACFAPLAKVTTLCFHVFARSDSDVAIPVYGNRSKANDDRRGIDQIASHSFAMTMNSKRRPTQGLNQRSIAGEFMIDSMSAAKEKLTNTRNNLCALCAFAVNIAFI